MNVVWLSGHDTTRQVMTPDAWAALKRATKQRLQISAMYSWTTGGRMDQLNVAMYVKLASGVDMLKANLDMINRFMDLDNLPPVKNPGVLARLRKAA